MKHAKILMAVALAGALTLVTGYGDQWDKKTIITIDAPMQLPTMTLQPGSYTVKLLDSASNRHIVTVWDKDGMKHLTTVLAIPNYKLRVSGKSTFTMWETPAGQPPALRAWFYPGDNFGQEFAYPKAKAQEIAAFTKTEVPTLTAKDEENIAAADRKAEETTTVQAQTETRTTPATAPEPVRQTETVVDTPPAVVAQAEPPATPVTPATPVEPEPAALAAGGQGAETIPQTASNWTEITLFGAIAGLAGLFLLRRQLPA